MKPIQVLQAHEIPTDSGRVRAVQAAAKLDYDANAYRVVIQDLCGITLQGEVDDDHAKHVFMYLVQDVMDKKNTSLPFALERANQFIKDRPWVLAKPEPTSSYVPKSTVDALGNPKQKKGAKKAKAIAFWNASQDKYTTRKQWIAALMENVGLTSGAASTYHHNLKTGKWS